MNTYCFKIYYKDIDQDDIVYIEANSKKEAITSFKKEYKGYDYKYLGEE